MNIIRKARGSVIPSTAQRVFLCLDSKNAEKRDTLITDLLQADPEIECVVSYTDGDSFDEKLLRDELREGTRLLVLYVTAELLQSMERWILPPEYSLAKEFEIPVLPIAANGNLFPRFTELAGAIHGIALTNDEYRANLSAQLRNFLVTSEMFQQIMEEAFASTIFLSYRKKDIKEARKFMKALHDIEEFEAVSVWYDNFLTAGRIFDEEIRASIENSNAFVLLVTPSLLEKNDMGKDNYVASTEYPYAKKWGKTVIAVEAMKTNNNDLAKSFPGIGNTCGMSDEALREAFRKNLGESGCLTQLDSERAYYLGMAYFKGVGVERDVNRGIKMFEKAVEAAGNVVNEYKISASTLLMKIYMHGEGVRIDYDKAYEWGNRVAIDAHMINMTAWHFDDNVHSELFRDLGSLLRVKKEYQKALEMHQLALDTIGDKDSIEGQKLSADIISSMANVYYDMGDITTAHQKHVEAWKMKVSLYGEDHPSCAYSLQRLACIFEDEKNYLGSMVYFRRAIAIQEKHLGSEHPATCASYNNLTTLLYETKNYSEAISVSLKILEIYKKMFGEIHPEISKILFNLAGYHWVGSARIGTIIGGRRVQIGDDVLKAREEDKKAFDYALKAYINEYQYYDGVINPVIQESLDVKLKLLKRIFTHFYPRGNFDEWLSQQLRQETEKTDTDKPQKKPSFFNQFRKKK
jgi:tetratricopeptide (TPR) repeat protein